MKIKPKGRKIYKTKEKNYYGKSPLAKVLSGALTVLLIGGIGFIGYSAAEPIINYTQHKGDEPSSEPVVTEPPTELVTRPAVTQPPTAPTEPEPEQPAFEGYCAAMLPESAMAGLNELSLAAAAVPHDGSFEYIEVPLKVSGGELKYVSTSGLAQYSGAIDSELTLGQIVQVIENNGFKAAAYVSTFDDFFLPYVSPESGYLTWADGQQWIDNDYDYGGRPWLTPYSDTALAYLSDIVGEITLAGFDRIVCSDLKFPEFSEYDLSILDPRLSRSDRFMTLTSAANLLYGNALSNGASMMLEVSAAEILSGSAEVLQPMLLSTNSIVVNIDIDVLRGGISDGELYYQFDGEPDRITEKCLGLIAGKLAEYEDINLTVRVSGASLTQEQLLKAMEMAKAMDYNSFVIDSPAVS